MVWEKVPVPVPFCTFESVVVGVVLEEEYTIPRSLTAAPPSDTTFPPTTALFKVIVVAVVVETVGLETDKVYGAFEAYCHLAGFAIFARSVAALPVSG
jgi:hypothetical protein